MQYFNRDTFEDRCVEVYKDLLADTNADVKKFYDEAYRSSELGAAIYDTKKTTIYESLSKERYKKAYWRIVEAQKMVGSIDGYLNLFYAVFGEAAQITITKERKHLRFDIFAKDFDFYDWITKDEALMTDKEGEQIFFKSVKLPISKKDLLSLLKKSSVHGALIELHINGD